MFILGTQNLDFEKSKVKVLGYAELQQFVGKPRYEVFEYVKKEYGDKYHIPGFEYEQYLLALPKEKIPEQLKDGNYYYFAGSALRNRVGGASAPFVRWHGDELDHDAIMLDDALDGADSGMRIVWRKTVFY